MLILLFCCFFKAIHCCKTFLMNFPVPNRKTAGYMEGCWSGAETTFISWMQLLQKTSTFWSDEWTGKILLQWHEQTSICQCMRVMVLAVFLSSSSTLSVAFLNCLSILIIVEALSSENKFLEPLCPCVVLCVSLLLFHNWNWSVSGWKGTR